MDVIELLKQQNELLTKALEEKAAAAGETAGRLHGHGGIFSTLGLSRDIVTAHVRPSGIGGVLPFFPSQDEDPRFGAITGYTDDVGDEPDNVCDDAPTGYLKACNLTALFGLLRRDTNTIDMGHTRLRINRGDFTDLVLRGRVLGIDNIAPGGLNESQILDLITMSEMVNCGVRMERQLNVRYWQGTVAAGQMPGLDVQIATGQVDADTNTACPALDSDVKDFDYDMIGGAGRSIVEYLGMLVRFVQYNAETMGLTPATWKLFMRPEMWWELTEIWPCEYNTNKCANSIIGSGSRVVIDGRDNISQRDALRQSMTLPINGQVFDVVTDTGIFLHDSTNNANLLPGQYASSIYLVPMTIVGNFPVTYFEYLDYSAGSMEFAQLRGLQDFWTDGGRYMWALEQNKFCVKFAARTEQRIILRTPHLAGRIDHVAYEPLQMLRSPDPESPYWVDGGVSVRDHTHGYAVWNPNRLPAPR
jgi:hypothetical protein